MIGLLVDANVDGHAARLVMLMQSAEWGEFWDYLDIQCLTIRDVGLASDASDAEVWQLCQERQMCLLTSNRNDDGPDSLAATIRSFSMPDSLPVFTLADADRVLHSTAYAQRVIDSLFDHLLRIDDLRGTGRLYLP